MGLNRSHMGQESARSSGRIGRHGGQLARTFHANFGSVKAGGGGAGVALDYATRQGEHSGRDDLECVVGSRDKVERVAEAIEATARRRKGPVADRVAITLVAELPADSSPAARQATAEAVVGYWRDRGHPAVAAVHMTGEDGQLQPHLHVIIAARRLGADGTTIDRSTRLLVGKAALRSERRGLADLINIHCGQAVRFLGGRDREMDQPGIVGRAPKRRVPERQWHRDGQREPDPVQASRAHERAVNAAEAAKRRRDADAKRREERLARAAANIGRIVAAPSELRGLVTQAEAAERRAAAADQKLRAVPATVRKIFKEIGKAFGVAVPDGIDSDAKAQSLWYAIMRAKGAERTALVEALRSAQADAASARAAAESGRKLFEKVASAESAQRAELETVRAAAAAAITTAIASTEQEIAAAAARADHGTLGRLRYGVRPVLQQALDDPAKALAALAEERERLTKDLAKRAADGGVPPEVVTRLVSEFARTGRTLATAEPVTAALAQDLIAKLAQMPSDQRSSAPSSARGATRRDPSGPSGGRGS